MINLKSGELFKESYDADKDDYLTITNKINDYQPPKPSSGLIFEVRKNALILATESRLIAKQTFNDEEFNKDKIYLAIDFESNED